MTETGEAPDPGLPARKLSTRMLVVVVAAAVLVLGGVGVGIYFLISGGDDPAASGTSTQDTSTAPTSPSGGPASGPTSQSATGGAPAEVGSVKTVAEQAISAINAGDAETMRKISCDPEIIGQETPPEAKAELVGDPQLTGDTATVELKVSIGEASSTTLFLPLRKQNGSWCVD